MLSDVETATIALTIQAALTGLQFLTFLLCLRWLIFSDYGWIPRKNIKWSMLIVTVLLIVFSVTILGLTLLSALFYLKNGNGLLPAGAVSTGDALNCAVVVAMDVVLIYRCWVVYDRWWPIAVFPVLLWMYNFSSIIVVVYWTASGGGQIQVLPLTLIYYDQRIDRVHAGFMIATILINIYGTSAIIMKLRRPGALGHRVQPAFAFVIRIITESGLIYTLATTVLVCAVFIRDAPNGNEYPMIIICAILPPSCGITFDLIVIRVAQNRASETRLGS